MARLISLIPIGEVNFQVLSYLAENLPRFFPGILVRVEPPIPVPPRCWVPSRGQFDGNCILESLPTLKGAKVLGIIDEDLFVRGLNFIFGLASYNKSLIALTRLRNEFYGLPPNQSLFLERALKEAIHELGHSYGLSHCPDPRCIMHFSNSLADTDLKGPGFCKRCKEILLRSLTFDT